VRFLLFIIPYLIHFITKRSGNTKTKIIAFCHAVVQIQMVMVTLYDLGVEVVVHVRIESLTTP
jgi:hypothetical protein